MKRKEAPRSIGVGTPNQHSFLSDNWDVQSRLPKSMRTRSGGITVKEVIFKSVIWIMDAMVDGLCPNFGKTMEDGNPILVTVAAGRTGESLEALS